MWLIIYSSPWLIHVPIITLMPTSQMEVRGQGTTNTILLQDARKPDWCAQNGNPACAGSSFPTESTHHAKARRLS